MFRHGHDGDEVLARGAGVRLHVWLMRRLAPRKSIDHVAPTSRHFAGRLGQSFLVLVSRSGESQGFFESHGGLGDVWGQRAKGLRLPGALGDAHAVGQVVDDSERNVGDVGPVMAPAPRGAYREENERAGAKPRMQRRQEKSDAKRANDASSEWAAGTDHVPSH